MATFRRVYLDHAATSFPKPPGVGEAMATYTNTIGASPGRGAYDASVAAGGLLADARMALSAYLGEADPTRIAFTLNCTDALSLGIHGVARHWLRQGEPVHMVTTAMDHNSVLRPLNDLAADGVTHTRVPADPDTGLVDPAAIKAAIMSHTRLVCVVHGSNVSGTVQRVASIGQCCTDAGVPLLVDGAQTAGHRLLRPANLGINLLAVPGHKGLLGPLGTGALWLDAGMEHVVAPVRTGGTGSLSEADVHPTALPDRYEAGSHNMVGLVGLGAALAFLEERGPGAVAAHEDVLTEAMLEGLLAIDDLRLLGPHTMDDRCGVFAMTCPNTTPGQFADVLEAHHGVLARAGIHCAPGAHETFGTIATGGATRLSLGWCTTLDDVDLAVHAVRETVSQVLHPRTAITAS